MLTKTKGVVLHSTKYSDTSWIVTIYTEMYGRTSFLVRGISNKRSATKAAIFQPLNVVGMDLFYNPAKEIHSIKDIRIDLPLIGIPYDPIKNALALFISELLFRSIKHSTPDEHLFLFLCQSIEVLDCTHDIPANFHLIFMLKLTRFLGFEPHLDAELGKYFDLINGEFRWDKPLHAHYIGDVQAQSLCALGSINYFTMNNLILARVQRAELLKTLIEYYRLHISGFNGLNSVAVLQSLFD